MTTHVGIIGVGNMGFGMSRNLLKAGYQVVVYDLRPEPLEALAAEGATIATDPGEVGRACGLVFSVVLDHPQNLAILEGPEGLFKQMAPGGTIFVCSTISPSQVRELADLAAAHELRLLDSPLSGGREGALGGTMSMMIGGDGAVLAEHRAVLEAVTANLYHLGDVGAGEAAKAVNQILVAVHDVATAEALMLASKSGIDLKQMYEIICTSAGQSWVFEHRAMRMIDRDFETRGALKILLKDIKVVLETAHAHGLVLPLSEMTRQVVQAGVNQGLGDEDDSACVKVLESLASFSLADLSP